MTRSPLNRPLSRFKTLFKQSFFWNLTAAGNAIILAGGFFLYQFEALSQGNLPLSFFDCLLWSTGTVTTIGYGSYTPHTFAGKVTIMILMLLGTLFVWSYMGFLVTGLITPELATLEKDVHEVEKEIQGISHSAEKL
ncbi:MAG: potassium channel family protein [Pseudobdellovibrio sp.]